MQDETQNRAADVPGDPTIGTPETDLTTWDGQQSFDDTCTIRSQEFILEQFTGQEFDEATLVEEAEANGFYTPGGGTTFEHTGSLLELHGVGIEQYWDATPYQLANELAQGHKVILSVDAGELWGEENPVLEEISGIADRDVDHDVVVSGIDTTDPNNPQVIVSDPGTGEAAALYPLDHFVAAWQDSSFFMMSTEEPVPPTAPEMANFDYEEGHLPELFGVPYDQFLTLQDQPEAFRELLEPVLETLGFDVGEDVAPEVTPLVDEGAALAGTEEPVAGEEQGEPTAPAPTLDPALLDPAASGPTLDPGLLDADPTMADPAEPLVDDLFAEPSEPAAMDSTAPASTTDPAADAPVTINISDVNLQVNEGGGTFTPTESGDIVTDSEAASLSDPTLDPTADPLAEDPLADLYADPLTDPLAEDPLADPGVVPTDPALDPTTDPLAEDPYATTTPGGEDATPVMPDPYGYAQDGLRSPVEQQLDDFSIIDPTGSDDGS